MNEIKSDFWGSGGFVKRWRAQYRSMQAGWFAICIFG